MAQDAGQKKAFVVPTREQLIAEIKLLDEDIEHVSLNLIRCHFDAKEDDVKKTFADCNLIKVKNYKPGSFQIVFEMKIDAIQFIRNSYDRKILGRRFFIKMGRQNKDLAEQWTGVGYIPNSFKTVHNKNRNFQHGKPQKHDETHKKPENVKKQEQEKGQQKEQKPKKEQKKQEPVKQPIKIEEPKAEVKKGITIETVNKPQQEKRRENRKKQNQEQKPKQYQKPKETTNTKPVEPSQNEKNSKKDKKKQEKPKEEKAKVEQPKIEDDEWIVVPTKKGRKN